MIHDSSQDREVDPGGINSVAVNACPPRMAGTMLWGHHIILTSRHHRPTLSNMRTTIDLDEDILRVAKHLAQEREQSLGRVLSDLVRRGLQPAGADVARCGMIPILPQKSAAQPVTAQAVKDLLEAEL